MPQPGVIATIARALAPSEKSRPSRTTKLTLWIAAFVLVLALRRALRHSKKALISDARQVAREVKEGKHDFDEYDFIIVGGGAHIFPGMRSI
jgi:hypothetical protein